MKVTESILRRLFSTQDYFSGMRDYQAGCVEDLNVENSDGNVELTAFVSDPELRTQFHVHTTINDTYLLAHCTCPIYSAGYYCKHLAAALYAYMQDYQDRPSSGKRSVKTSYAAGELLRQYLAQAAVPEDPVHLTLQAFLNSHEKPILSFRLQVGRGRMYVVQNIRKFLDCVTDQAEASYGKSLTFNHSIENFDAPSQDLLRLLLNEILEDDNYSHWNDPNYKYKGLLSDDGHRIELQGNAFDRLYDLLCGSEIPLYNSHFTLRFQTEDPKLSAQIQAMPSGASLVLQDRDEFAFFGGPMYVYAITSLTVMRCSQEFRDNLFPLMSLPNYPITFSDSDLPTFCDCVLPRVSPFMEIEDPDDILSKFTPDPCTANYYLDLDRSSGLVASLRFQYGETEIPDGEDGLPYQNIRRNVRMEQQFRSFLDRLMQYDDVQRKYYLSEDEKILDFLSDRVPDLQKNGSVYISNTLRNAFLNNASSKPAVGVSVSNGLLSVSFDTGEFPAEELEELYNSLLKKKRYYKLHDGRYLVLNGTGYEKLAEIAHMTQVKTQDLKNGSAEMPVYWGLYLDLALSNEEGVGISRDKEFRRLVHNFKDVENSDFQVPERLEKVLRPYQKVGFQWMKTLEANGFGGILADEMGLGKTLEAIAFLYSAYQAGQERPSLIVCPASLILNWAEELERFTPDLPKEIIMGSAGERHSMIKSAKSGVWVTSYDLLKRDISLYREKEFYCCILDEGQHIKNPSTQASKAVKTIHCRQRFVLTGTPIENRLSELWNLFDFLMPGFLFSHNVFVQRLEKPIIQSGDSAAQRQLNLLVQPFMLRRLKRDVLKDLPDKLEYVRRIPQSEQERKVYLAESMAALKAAEAAKEKLQILALLTRLRQISCAPSLCFENYSGTNSKLDACMELCESMVENGHQILLFSQFTSMLDLIRERLNEAEISSFTLQGSTPKEKRAQLVKEFGNGKASVFLISLRAGGTGLNLTSADVVIHYDPWWNLAVQNQATDRAHRIGQTEHVQVYKLITADTIEEKIMELQDRKGDLLDAVSDSTGLEPLSREELLDLLR